MTFLELVQEKNKKETQISQASQGESTFLKLLRQQNEQKARQPQNTQMSATPVETAPVSTMPEPVPYREHKTDTSNALGRYGRGNVDLYNRPQYQNTDGTVSTVDSRSYKIGGKEVLLPTVWMKNGRPYRSNNDAEILQHYRETGEHLGQFSSANEANAYAQRLHNQQEDFYKPETQTVASTLPKPTNTTVESMTQEPEKKLTLGERIRNRWNAMMDARNALAEYEARQYTDDVITPAESLALGAAQAPISIGNALGKGITSITKNKEDDARGVDAYNKISAMQKTAQEANPGAYSAGQIAADVMLMEGISSVFAPVVGAAGKAVSGASKAAQTIVKGAAGAASTAATFATKEAISGVGDVAMGKTSGKEYGGGILKSAASGLTFGTVSAVLSAGGTEILRGLNNRGVGGIDWTAPFAWFTKEVVSGMGGASASIGLDYALASPTAEFTEQYKALKPNATESEIKTAYKEEMKKGLGKQFLMMFFFSVIGAAKSTESQLAQTRSAFGMVEDYLRGNFSDDAFLEKASRYAAMSSKEKAAFANEVLYRVNLSRAQINNLFSEKGYYGVGMNQEGQRLLSALDNIERLVSVDIPTSGAADASYGNQLMKMISDASETPAYNSADVLAAAARGDADALARPSEQTTGKSNVADLLPKPQTSEQNREQNIADMLPKPAGYEEPTIANDAQRGIIKPTNDLMKEGAYGGAEGDYGNGAGRMGLYAQRSAVETGRVDEGAGALGARDSLGAEAERVGGARATFRVDAKDAEVSKLTLDGDADASTFGIQNADVSQKVRLVESGNTPAMKTAEIIASKAGKKLTPFVGNYLAVGNNKFVQAVSMPNGDIIAAADDPEFTIDRLAGHEVCEDEIRIGNVSVPDAIRYATEKVGGDKVERVLEVYRDLHYEEKELVCDAAGNMNRLEAHENLGRRVAALKNDIDDVLEVLHDYVNVGGLYDDVPALSRQKAQFSSRPRNGISELEENNGRKEIQQTADTGTVRRGNVGDNALDTESSARGRGQGDTGRGIRRTSQTVSGRSVQYERLTDSEKYFAHTLLFDPIDNGPEEYRSLYKGYSVTNLDKHLYEIFSDNTKEFQYLCRQIPELKKGADTLFAYLSGNDAGNKPIQKTDSSGLELTENQYKYFSNSKETDNDGHLKIMYRGGNTDIDVFDRKKSSPSNLFGRGFYFTDSVEHAKQFGNPTGYYLNITNPIRPGQNNITKAQMREFLKAVAANEDYGLDNYGYGSTAESVLRDVYGKGDFEMLQDVNATAIGDLVAAVELFNEVNGTDYDGIILPTETVIFRSEQAKKVTNQKPTSSQNVNFSMAAPVEEIEKLVAVHNLTEKNLADALDLGGLPMPSIAVVKAKNGHSKYGPISLVFGKDTIDPKMSDANRVYGGDAYTPTAPSVGYKVDYDVMKSIRDKLHGLLDDETYNTMELRIDTENMTDKLQRSGGDFKEAYGRERGMKLAFLKDTGRKITVPKKDKAYRADVPILRDIIKKFDVLALQEMGYEESKTYEPQIRKMLYDYKIANDSQKTAPNGKTFARLTADHLYGDTMSYSEYTAIIDSAADIKRHGVKRVIDTRRLDDRIDAYFKTKKMQTEYEAWLDELSNGIIAKKGIRNNADYFTRSGNRRSFEALYDDYTLSNIVKAMKAGQEERGGQTMGVSAGLLQSVATPSYGSIAEIKADSGRLARYDDEAYEAMKKEIDDELMAIVERIYNTTKHWSDNSFIEYDSIAEAMINAARRGGTADAIVRSFKRDGYDISKDIAQQLQGLYKRSADLPTEYFEAKPRRGVGFDEVLAVVAPKNINAELKQRLEAAGANVLSYKAGDETDRLKKINSVQGAQFSTAASRDSIKALARMTTDRIDYLIEDSGAGKSKTYAQKWITSINPTDFLNLTLKETSQNRDEFDNRPGDYGETVNDGNYVEYLKKETRQTPFLEIYRDGTVAGHEGRHRMRALEKSGVTSAEVVVMFVDEDGRLLKSVNNVNGRLETLKQIKIKNQYGTGQTAKIQNIIPLNLDHRDEILTSYGSDNAEPDDVVYSDASGTEGLRALQKENERLRKKLEESKRQTTVTTKPVFTDRTVASAANSLIRTTGADVKADEIKPRLKEFFDYMANDPTSDGMFERASDIATDLIDSAKELASDVELYNRVRGYLKNNKLFLSQEYRSDVNYKDFVKNNPGIKMSKNGLPVDVAYAELQEVFGEWLFPSDVTHPADQLEQIADVLDRLEPFYRNPYSLEMEKAYSWATDAVIDAYFDAKEAPPTYADKAEKKLEAQRVKYERKLDMQQANYEDALTKQEADYEAEIKRRQQNAEFMVQASIAKEKRLRDEKIAALKEHYRDVATRKRELKQERSDREKLRKIVQRLQGKKVDPVTKAMLPDIVKELDATAVNITDKSISNLAEMRQWYNDKTTEGSEIYDPNFIPDKATLRKLERLEKAMKGMTIGQMDIVQVRELTEILQNIEHQANEARKFQQSKLKIDNYEAGLRTIQDIENARPGKINRELSPQRAARRIAGYNDGAIEGTEASPLITLMDETVEGERKADIYQRTALHRMSRWTEDKDFMRKLYGRRADRIMITGIDARTGETRNVAITPAMRISLYLHSKNDDNMRHIQEGGVVIPGERNYRAGKMAEAYAEDIRIKLTKANVNRIVSGMSAKERAFADAIWRYFNEYAPQRLNEASVLIDGYEKFNEENYFPISVDKNFLSQDYESVIMEEDGSLTHPGFGEERIQSAKPIYLRDVNDVFMTAVRTNSMYACQAVPLMNLAKLVNVQQKGATDSVTAAMNRRFTAAKTDPINTSASEYLAKYMRDYAGNRGGKKSGLDKMLSQLRSNYSGGVLTLAAGTAIKQAASYPTAAAVVSTRALASAMNPARTVDVSFIDEMTAAFTKRTEGLSTVELAEMTQEGKTIPRALNWIQAVDVGTTKLLKRAAAIEVQITTDLRIGSPEYKKAVVDMYIKIIEQTQPNYSIALRPDILRSDSALERALVMFATQPMQNFGILYDAVGNYRAKQQAYKNSKNANTEKAFNAAKKKLGKAVGSQVAASLVFALMQYAYDVFRRKDDKYKEDGETTLLSFAKGIGINMLSNGAGMFIAGKVALELGETITDKIVKAFGGESVFNSSVYGFEVAELEAITNAASSAINAAGTITSELYKVFDGDKETSVNVENLARKTWTAAEDVLLLFGIPLENATTTLTSVAKNVCTLSMGKYLGGYYAIRISTDPSSSKKPFYDNLYNCYVNGNSRDLRRLYNAMLEDGFDADKIKTAMEDRMKDKEHVKSVKDLKKRWVAP